MPAEEMIDPGVDREEVMAELLDRELGAPPVVDERRHARFAMLRITLVTMEHDGGDDVVTVRENVGLDHRDVTSDALRGKASIVDGWRNTFNDDASASVESGSGHELASCELHASAQRTLCGDRIVQFQKPLSVAAHRENVLVAGSFALGALQQWTRIAAEV
jgi:hypothetical protein